MRMLIVIGMSIILVFSGCHQNDLNTNKGIANSTTKKIYNESWDGNPIIVIKTDKDVKINSIQDSSDVKLLINKLNAADWQENVEVDIRPPDYYFKWNAYTHNVWVNEVTNRLELSIEGKSNYGVLSSNYSKIVSEMLIDNINE